MILSVYPSVHFEFQTIDQILVKFGVLRPTEMVIGLILFCFLLVYYKSYLTVQI